MILWKKEDGPSHYTGNISLVSSSPVSTELMKERDKEGVTMIFKVRKLFSLFNAFYKYLIVLERHGRIWQEQSWQNNK